VTVAEAVDISDVAGMVSMRDVLLVVIITMHLIHYTVVRGAFSDRQCRDVVDWLDVGRWSSACVAGSLPISRRSFVGQVCDGYNGTAPSDAHFVVLPRPFCVIQISS